MARAGTFLRALWDTSPAVDFSGQVPWLVEGNRQALTRPGRQSGLGPES